MACNIYYGPGRGSIPSNLTYGSINGCTLTGGFDATDAPGVYGFIVTVTDNLGQTTQVPVVMRNGTCSTAVVTIVPPEYPVRTAAPGAAFDTTVTASDLNMPCVGGDCAANGCRACYNQNLSSTQPMTFASNLDCSNPGDICIDTTLSPFVSCSALRSVQAVVRVRSHTPVRSDGGPAWITLEHELTYSGAIATQTACGNKTWSCHWDVFVQ